MHPMLNIAVRAARRAGSIINRAALGGERARGASRSGANDFVTQVDQAAEEAIIDIVRKAYPDHGFLAEESGARRAATAEYRWIIDPLDGTTNFIHGFPQYCVSIGVQHRGALDARRGLRPGEERAVHRLEGPRRLPQRPAHPRLEVPAPAGRARRHRLSRSRR